MSLIREIPPTAGWPIAFGNLALSVFKKHPKGLLEEDFKKYLGAPAALLTYSGTAAFYIILESIKKISPKKTVIFPAFICPLIPLAIKKAGLKLKVCDTNADNFDFDLSKLNNICAADNDILAILAVHLAGLPIDFNALKLIAQKSNAFIIEDCAQSLGAQDHGKKTGSLGDFSFFSLCRGKGLTIYEGGVAVANNAGHVQLLKDTAYGIMKRNIFSECLKMIELFAYSIFYRPALFWFAFRLPQIFWQMFKNPVKAMGEYFKPDFPVHKVSAFREYIGHLNFTGLNKEISGQRKKTAIYLDGLKEVFGIKPIVESAQTEASYPFLALILENKQKRDSALDLFKNSGMGISQVYLYSITDYVYLKNIVPNTDCPHSRQLSEKTITLSTSSFLKDADLKKIVRKLKQL